MIGNDVDLLPEFVDDFLYMRTGFVSFSEVGADFGELVLEVFDEGGVIGVVVLVMIFEWIDAEVVEFPGWRCWFDGE